MNRALLALCTISLCASATAASAAVTVNFTGKITSVDAALASGFSTNQPVSGSITYNDKATPNNSTSSAASYYNAFSGGLTLGNKTFAFSPTTVTYVSNNNSSKQDQVSFYSGQSTGPTVGGYAPGYFTISLYDLSQAVLNSTAVPTASQLAEFPTKNFTLYFGTDYSHAVTGTFSAITAVPEPASWAMMILGMGAIGYALRRRAVPLLRSA